MKTNETNEAVTQDCEAALFLILFTQGIAPEQMKARMAVGLGGQ